MLIIAVLEITLIFWNFYFNKYGIICLVAIFLTVDDRDSLYLICVKKYILFR